jgi:hypothetical protein
MDGRVKPGHDGLEGADNTLMRAIVRLIWRWGTDLFLRLIRNSFCLVRWGMTADANAIAAVGAQIGIALAPYYLLLEFPLTVSCRPRRKSM